MPSESEQAVRKYLEGAEYPAKKGDLAAVAKKNGAPEEFVDQVQGLKETSFSDPSQGPSEFSSTKEVVEALER